jgi:predicted nicotinamide N-methyase
MKDKRILELGSGPGLGGFLTAHWAKQVIFSDY